MGVTVMLQSSGMWITTWERVWLIIIIVEIIIMLTQLH
jgi:hypothetical protein